MRVNSAFNSFLNSRWAITSAVAVLVLALFFIASSFTKRSHRDVLVKQANLAIRQIGDQLLRQSGDLTSQVLPVREVKEGTFRLEIENDLIFSHDSLIALSQNLLTKEQFPSGYTVTVHGCVDDEIVYGFQINNASPHNLACKGRSQNAGCYAIEFSFPDFYANTSDYPSVVLAYGGALVLLSMGLVIGRLGRKTVSLPLQKSAFEKQPLPEMSAIGKFMFDVKAQRLMLGTEVISLTEKECQVLELLNENFGELITRETLMQKIWINEGVITGRSLDMFISKLRKKLSSDPELRITNVHGKGYKLESGGQVI